MKLLIITMTQLTRTLVCYRISNANKICGEEIAHSGTTVSYTVNKTAEDIKHVQP